MVKRKHMRVDKEFYDIMDEIRRETNLSGVNFTKQVARSLKTGDIKCDIKKVNIRRKTKKASQTFY